ncbi:class I SAM-dependent methyltransferase [Nocardioides agariphilus]|jgi:SAM-dependent methyltransferase|nr:class I SAM-dependent methyltransferase [Nocardioides agariphilus]
MSRLREEVLSSARGDVLEVGAGTGLNLGHYPTGLRRLVLTEPVSPMADRLRRRADDHAAVEVVQAAAEQLPFENASFDTVVSTLVLCTVHNVEASLSEVARVLKPGGRLLFIEHVRAADETLARRQARWAGAWSAFAMGCRCDRDTLGSIRAQFDVGEHSTAAWHGMPSIVRPLVLGVAVPSRELRHGSWDHHVSQHLSQHAAATLQA